MNLYRELLNLRHSMIVPSLEFMADHNVFAAVTDKTLVVNWMLGENHTLRLMANLSRETSPFPEQILSTVIYRTERSSDPEMAPWDVVWSVTS